MIASDITEGLFVLSPTYVQAAYLEGVITDAVTLSPIDVVDVQISVSNQGELTNSLGFYATGFEAGGTYDVSYSKVGYYPQTISVSISNGVVTTQDVQLVPIPTYNLNVTVLEASTGSPVDAADIRLEAALITHDGVTNALGQESMVLYYEEEYKVYAGKWNFVTSCDQVMIDNATGSLTIYIDSGFYDDFTFDFGWTTGGDATNGHFERGEPFGTTSGSNPDFDSDNDCSVNCYVTGNAPNLDSDFDDVVGGSVILRSPVMDLTTYIEPYLNYEWYFFNFHGPMPPFDDTLKVTVSNGIVNDVVLQAQGSDPGLFFNWYEESKKLSDYITITNTMQFTFETSDYDPAVNITEAAIDHFFIAEEAELGLQTIKNGLRIYPNPAENILNVDSFDRSDFSLVGMDGKTVYRGFLEVGSNQLNVEFLENGIYYLQSGNLSYKFVITK